MAGKNTVVIDNPALTVRFYHGQNPVRVIMDTSATLLSDKQIFTSKAETWIINQQLSGTVNSVEYIQVNDTGNLAEVMSLLFLRGMNTVLVEGGSKLLKAMIQWGGWHEARILVSPEKLHDGLRAPFLAGKVQSKLRLGGDLISIIKNPKVE
jgi:diaminohydroxyphosphoribosylaminopyrimidine deaminase/5-amino-6-(5-phosphoribosylamino)uracil reductase